MSGNGFQDARWVVWMVGYAIRAYKRTEYIHEVDDIGIICGPQPTLEACLVC